MLFCALAALLGSVHAAKPADKLNALVIIAGVWGVGPRGQTLPEENRKGKTQSGK